MDENGQNPHFSGQRRDIWKELTDRVSDGEEWDGSTITVRHGEFAVVLDVHAEVAGYGSRVETRFRAAYINRDGFRFRARRSTWVMDLATILGGQDVEMGEEEFDREFVLQTNNPSELKRLLAPESFRRRLVESPVNLVEVRDDEGEFGPRFPGEVDELYLSVGGRHVDIESLERLYGLFADLLDRLCQIGSAYQDDPEISL